MGRYYESGTKTRTENDRCRREREAGERQARVGEKRERERAFDVFQDKANRGSKGVRPVGKVERGAGDARASGGRKVGGRGILCAIISTRMAELKGPRTTQI